MRTIVAAFLLVIIMILTASWAVGQTRVWRVEHVKAAEPQVKPCGVGRHPIPCPTPTTTPTPTPVPTPTPTPPPSGWALAFDDQFTTWDPSRYFVYPNTWRDTSGNGWRNCPGGISSDGALLRGRLWTLDGTACGVHFVPIPAGSLSARGDLNSMRVEFRIRADRMVGYKGVPLLWPMSGIWPRDGEINWPESNFDARPSAFMHRQDATSSSDQDWYPAPTGTSWQDWHVYVTEWVSGTSAEFFIDGVSIGRSTSRVPNTPMHLVMQFETALSGGPPDPSVSGFVEIDYLRVWSR